MRTSTTTSAVFDAIVKANGLLSAVKKDKRANAGSFSYAYASLDTVIDHVHVPLMEHGLAVVQEAVSADAPGFVGVTTRLVHRSGEWVEYGPLFLPGGKDAQSYGSAISYARRYALSAALGLATEEDDDGKAATQPKPKKADARKQVETNEWDTSSGGESRPFSGEGAVSSSPPGSSESGGSKADRGAAPASGPTPASQELWAEARAAGVTATKAMKALRDEGVEVASSAEITDVQLRGLMQRVNA